MMMLKLKWWCWWDINDVYDEDGDGDDNGQDNDNDDEDDDDEENDDEDDNADDEDDAYGGSKQQGWDRGKG